MSIDLRHSCPDCGSNQSSQVPGEAWHCRACKPDMPLRATTLTLPCHKVELRPVAAHVGLRALFENACQGLSITPKQLQQELEAGDDIPDLVSGALTPAALRSTAAALNTRRYAGEALESTPAEARRRAVLSMLANEPGITYALPSDTEAQPDAVIITLTIRDKAICELRIPKDRYDGLAMLQMLEKQTGESYAERTRDVSKLRTTHAGRDRECQTIRRYGQIQTAQGAPGSSIHGDETGGADQRYCKSRDS